MLSFIFYYRDKHSIDFISWYVIMNVMVQRILIGSQRSLNRKKTNKSLIK